MARYTTQTLRRMLMTMNFNVSATTIPLRGTSEGVHEGDFLIPHAKEKPVSGVRLRLALGSPQFVTAICL